MRRIAAFTALLCLTIGLAHADDPITIGERITIKSKILDEERTILVSIPPGYEQTTQHFPVLYMTDGGAHFSHTRGTVDFLSRNGLMPQVIIVGINNTDRTRDLTPTHVPSRTINGRTFENPTSGGANKFLKFFSKELFPYIDENYRTLPMRLFTGHSFGGLFALNAFFTQPEMFNAVLAVSPSLNWDDDLPIRQAEKFFKKRDELNATLFVAMANEEEGDPAPTRLDQLEQILEGSTADGFEWDVMHMPDEDHGSVVLRAHYWGFRSVFEGWQVPTDPETGRLVGGLDEIVAHYAKLSKRYGVTVMPEEQIVNRVGYQILGNEDFDGAIEVFRFNAELYPGSANVYDSLGEALENAGRLEEALANYSKAVESAEKTGDERLEIFSANRDRVKKQLAEAATE
jgi:predicted alpha/beta superfamily hydrolase